MKKNTSLLVCFAICIFSFAQAPQQFNYQGVARGHAGNPFSNQLLGFKLSILQGSSTGTVVYVETQAITSDSKGIFSLQVGGGTVVSGVFSSIGWGINSYWLKTEIDTTGGSNYQFMGASQMLSVPYALYANSAGNAGFTNMQVFSTVGTYTFTIPAGVTKIMVEVWGGGGGGSCSNNYAGGGGGYGKGIYSVVPASNYAVTVGVGGTGSASGTDGGSSSFGVLISATGGLGGSNGGVEGTSSAPFNISGGSSGGYGTAISGGDGGNGGSGGRNSEGASNNSGNGFAGKAPAGGGGNCNGGTVGGNGASGRVVVWW